MTYTLIFNLSDDNTLGFVVLEKTQSTNEEVNKILL